jgi:hypothetical protein
LAADERFLTHADRPALGTKSKPITLIITFLMHRSRNAYAWRPAACWRLVWSVASVPPFWPKTALMGDSDLACQMMGVISVPLFSTLPAVQVKGILQDCGASLVFVSDENSSRKFATSKTSCPPCAT